MKPWEILQAPNSNEPKWQRVIITLIALYPVLFIATFLVLHPLAVWQNYSPDRLELRYRESISGLIGLLVYGAFYLFPLSLLFSKENSVKFFGVFIFLINIVFSVFSFLILPVINRVDSVFYFPRKIWENRSPDGEYTARLYSTYLKAKSVGNTFGDEYIMAVHGKHFARKVVYISTYFCGPPKKVS